MTEWKFCPQCTKPLITHHGEDGGSYPACPDGHFTHYDNPAPTTIGLVEYDGKFLILKRGREPEQGKWDLPGGFIETGEDPSASMLREVREETGLDGQIKRIIGAYPSVYGDDSKTIVGIVYLVSVDSAEVTLSPENTEYEWRTLEEIPELAFPDTNQAVAALIAAQTA